jgi:DNA replication protein DnaD
MDSQEMSNGFTENVEPIPNINSNINSNDIPPQEEADGWRTVIHLYENNIRPLTSRIELDKLYSLYTDYGQMWLSAAITEAVENGAHNIKYIAAIEQFDNVWIGKFFASSSINAARIVAVESIVLIQ